MSTRDSQSSLGFPVPRIADFYTEGSLDWLSLSTIPLEFSLEALSRCTAAGVDPYSVVIGLLVAQNLCLGTIGRQNVQKALFGLKCYGGFENALWFGFGIKSFARVLGTTDQGCSLLAICSALSESFHEKYSAEVFHNMVLLQKPPGEYTPRANEWLMLVRECSGVFARTKFPVLAERLMRLVHNTQRLTLSVMPNQSAPLAQIRGCPKPEDLAKAILGIVKVKTGEYDAIAIHGCAAVGWLGAIAEWLYDLTVTIQDTEGNVLYSSITTADPQESRIQIMFHRPGGNQEFNGRDAVEVGSRTYQLHDYSGLIRARSDDVTIHIVSGRLAWQSCLSSAFGAGFARLLSIHMDVGIAIGCAARIFNAIGSGDSELDPNFLFYCRSYFDASSGEGFILNVLRWFPELEMLRRQMDEGVRMTLLDAKTQYEVRLAAIQNHCSCACCYNWNFDNDGEGFCLVVMFETIVVLSRILSGTNVAEGLLPMRAGFEALYQKQLSVRHDPTVYGLPSVEEDSAARSGEDLGPIMYVLDTKGDEDDTEIMADNVTDRRVVDTLRLFTGRTVTPLWWEMAAQSVNGLCAYLDILTEFSVDSERVGLVHVVPGRIERDHKAFHLVDDLSTLEYTVDPLLPFLSKSRFRNVSILLMETVTGLKALFEVGDKTAQVGKTIQVGPAYLVQAVTEARGLVPCVHRDGNRDIKPEVEVDQANYPVLKFVWGEITVHGIDCQEHGDLYLAVALTQAKISYICVLCEHECLQCCLSYAFGQGTETMIFLRKPSSQQKKG